MSAQPYRWNTSEAAEGYDKAAAVIHPHYRAVQDQIRNCLHFRAGDEFLAVDLGAGSGRFVERLLERYANARAVLVDQSEPFLAIAERRLARHADRALVIQQRLQDDWPTALPGPPQAIVSMSAIHHLEPFEKRALYARCYEALASGGVFINGDEFRPENDAEYRALLERWSAHMNSALKHGDIPPSFAATLDHWYDRNIRRFGAPKQSGDDCHESLAAQTGYLHVAGFDAVEIAWAADLWAVVVARKN